MPETAQCEHASRESSVYISENGVSQGKRKLRYVLSVNHGMDNNNITSALKIILYHVFAVCLDGLTVCEHSMCSPLILVLESREKGLHGEQVEH